MGTRREARERSLTLCYELDVRGHRASEMLDDLPAAPDPYTERLVRGVHERRSELDAAIAAAAEHWSLERMAVVDRVLLRIGAYELAHCPEVPRAVAISEAVELAKRYSTEESGSFVNGVLSRLAAELRGPEPEAVDRDRRGGDVAAG